MGLRKVGNATLVDAAADAYQRGLNAGAPDSVTSSYRTKEAQQKLYNGWVNRLPGYNFALPPEKSDHCKGIAIDLKGSAAKQWWRAHPEFGFRFTDPSENWHIAYRQAYDRYYGQPIGGTTPPVDFEGGEMTIYYEALSDGSNGVVKKGTWYSQTGNGPVVGLSNLEVEGGLRPRAAEKRIVMFQWAGEDIEILMARYGEAEIAPLPEWPPMTGIKQRLNLGRLTGRVRYLGATDWEKW